MWIIKFWDSGGQKSGLDIRRVVIVEKKLQQRQMDKFGYYIDRGEWSEDMRGESSELRKDHEGLNRDVKINK